MTEPELQKLVQGAKRGERLHTIGRLDCETSGLILFTTDGYFSHRVAALGVSKTYVATLKNPVIQNEQLVYITRAAQGLILPPEKKFNEQTNSSCAIKFNK